MLSGIVRGEMIALAEGSIPGAGVCFTAMVYLVAGLVAFLGIHSVRIFADDWRTARIVRMGEGPWKIVYSVLSIAAFVLLLWGYGAARKASMDLWMPPEWTRYVAALLTLLAAILLAATYVPGTHIKTAVKHPMMLSVKTWAAAHLIATGRLADVVLFGAFLAWSVLAYRAARGRDRAKGTTYAAIGVSRDAIAVLIGAIAWAVFAFYLHERWVGVRPLG